MNIKFAIVTASDTRDITLDSAGAALESLDPNLENTRTNELAAFLEHELMPMAQAMGLGVLPWSPLGGGILTGKYSRSDLTNENDANVSAERKGIIASSGHLTERALLVSDVVGEVACALGATRSQVALAWTLRNPTVVSPIMGARTLAQAEDNFGALDVILADEHLERLDQASALAPIFPTRFMSRPMAQQLVFGRTAVAGRR